MLTRKEMRLFCVGSEAELRPSGGSYRKIDFVLNTKSGLIIIIIQSVNLLHSVKGNSASPED